MKGRRIASGDHCAARVFRRCPKPMMYATSVLSSRGSDPINAPQAHLMKRVGPPVPSPEEGAGRKSPSDRWRLWSPVLGLRTEDLDALTEKNLTMSGGLEGVTPAAANGGIVRLPGNRVIGSRSSKDRRPEMSPSIIHRVPRAMPAHQAIDG